MTKQDDALFLLEVLVDKIIFTKSPCMTDKDFRTCVNIEAPSVEPLEICDDEPGMCAASGGGPFIKSFNTGKSCLFSLKESDISKYVSQFPIKITVYKSLPCECLPTKIVLGEATIDMTKEFAEARKIFLEDPTTVSYQALKDSFKIMDTDGGTSGEILMFLRISCYGKLIITRFQGATGPPNLGANENANTVGKDVLSGHDPCVHNTGTTASGAAPCLASAVGGRTPCPLTPDPYNSMPCAISEDSCYCSGPKPAGKAIFCKDNHHEQTEAKDCCPSGNKVIFQLPVDACAAGHKQRAYFNFTSDGVGDVARDEPGQLVPANSEQYKGVVYDFPPQVIKLRIAKTVEMPNRKSKLEYQFITPAFSQNNTVPVTDTRTAQCKPSCNCCTNRCC